MKWTRYLQGAVIAAASLLLVSCASLGQLVGGQPPISPSAVADTTKLDESALLVAEVSYKAARTIIETAVDEGRIKPALAAKFFRLNGDINAVLVKAREAYDAANSDSYFALIDQAKPLIDKLWALLSEQEKPDVL
jgi:hypothetical protein